MITNFKIFENNYDILNIKKYVLWKMKYYIFILEVTKIDDKFVQMKRLYKYIDDYNKILQTDIIEFEFSYEDISKKVIYSSDNLNDCLDLNLLAASFITDKYNI